MIKVSVCITSHERSSQLANAIYFVTHQTYPVDEIKVYGSGYNPPDLDNLGVPVSYEHNWQDWGHHKRAKAFQELSGDYIWTVADDDQYPFTFLERMLPGMEAGADIVHCNYGTKTRQDYWVRSKPERGFIGNGCILVSKNMAKSVRYTDVSYGGDWSFINSCLEKGATTHHVDEFIYFHS